VAPEAAPQAWSSPVLRGTNLYFSSLGEITDFGQLSRARKPSKYDGWGGSLLVLFLVRLPF
ncbi:hypothetical protein, partial [Klebsiella quasipneumoniae]